MGPPCLRVLRIVQCMIDFVRRTKFDLYQTRSPPFGRLMLSKERLAGCDPVADDKVRHLLLVIADEYERLTRS